MRATHRAKVGELCAFGGESFVVEFFCLFGVEAEVELILPTELEARF